VKFFLSSDLYGHRRGRFLASILNVEEWSQDSRPASGFVLVCGEAFQQAVDKEESYLSWARQPGCCLLLLPPFKVGPLIDGLDWSISFSSTSQSVSDAHSLADVVAQEVMYQLNGSDGSSESSAGHYWNDHSSHTRYWKAHTNSGLVAATVLPLWSISLMDHAVQVLSFLTWLSRQTGKVSSVKVADEVKPALVPEDNTVLVCCYGMKVFSVAALSETLNKNAVPLLDLNRFDLPASFERLRSLGYLDNHTLTNAGLAYLQSSPYWAFAEHLKGVHEP
jgi:hypothetical protein